MSLFTTSKRNFNFQPHGPHGASSWSSSSNKTFTTAALGNHPTDTITTKCPMDLETLQAIQVEYESTKPTSQYQLAHTIKTCPVILNIYTYPCWSHMDTADATTTATCTSIPTADTNAIAIRPKEKQFKNALDQLMTMVHSIQKDIHTWEDALEKLSKVFDWPKSSSSTPSKDDDPDDDNNNNKNGDNKDDVNHVTRDDEGLTSSHHKFPSPVSLSSSHPKPWTKFSRLALKQKKMIPKASLSSTSAVQWNEKGWKYKMMNMKTYLQLLRKNDNKGRWDKVVTSSSSSSFSSLLKYDDERNGLRWLDQIQYTSLPHKIDRKQQKKDGETEWGDPDSDTYKDNQDKEHVHVESFWQKKNNKEDSITNTNTIASNGASTISTTNTQEEPLHIRLSRLFQSKSDAEEELARRKEREESERIDREIYDREEKERLELERKIQQDQEKEEEARRTASKLLRPLTEEERDIVHDALYGIGSSSEIVAKTDTDSVQRRSMHTLRPCSWLNDEVIHYFLNMLAVRDETLVKKDPSKKRSHFFKSFFFTKLFDEGASNSYQYSNVKRWSKKVPGKDVFNLDKILFICNIGGMHWTCACAFMKKKEIRYYDSMGGSGNDYVKGVFRYLQDEWKSKHGVEMPDADEWDIDGRTPSGTPRQQNGYDCGVFACMICDFLSMDRKLAFSQDHINQCRDRIALSIMKGAAME